MHEVIIIAVGVYRISLLLHESRMSVIAIIKKIPYDYCDVSGFYSMHARVAS